MTRWECCSVDPLNAVFMTSQGVRTVRYPRDVPKFVAGLGADGWELVSVHPLGTDNYSYHLKRPAS
jgi:hypothetical protein